MNEDAINLLKIGYDFDGTADHLFIPYDNAVIITGRSKKDEKELRKVVGNRKIYFYPDDREHTDENVALWKSEMINSLGIDRYYEDTDDIVEIIRENTDAKIIDVEPETELIYITLTSGWDGMPIAYHLQIDGAESLVGQVQNKKELKQEDDEDPDDKKERLSQYDNLIKKFPARKLVDALKNVKNKDRYFIFCDQNALWTYAEELLKNGFTKGLFPLQNDYDFEKNREEAMKFVEENYPDIKIIPHEKYSTVEEARAAVEESDVPLVIQSEGDYVSTICPGDDVEQNHIEILSALDKHEKEYSKGQIILKEKLVQPIEITPQIVFWNGEPVFTDLDIETKNIGDGENNGNQVGCGTNLIIKTNLEDRINQIAFPPKVFEMAKERKGIFVWDISLYITEKGIYFGEFCSNRFGYDALMTEMMMSGGTLEYFRSIVKGENPLKEDFGAAVRVFNLNRNKDQNITTTDEYSSWLYEVKKKDQLLSVGDCWDLAVVTGAGSTFTQAVENAYENIKKLTFKEKYTRTKDDFLRNYPTSIAHRFKETNHVYFEVPNMEEKEEDVGEMTKSIKNIQSQVEGGLKNVEELLNSMKDLGTVKKNLAQRIKEKLLK